MAEETFDLAKVGYGGFGCLLGFANFPSFAARAGGPPQISDASMAKSKRELHREARLRFAAIMLRHKYPKRRFTAVRLFCRILRRTERAATSFRLRR
jgi:hypothetical protein